MRALSFLFSRVHFLGHFVSSEARNQQPQSKNAPNYKQELARGHIPLIEVKPIGTQILLRNECYIDWTIRFLGHFILRSVTSF